MIKDLRLQGVQSHKDTTFEFVPGINVITGPSDVGKSTVIRGLKWLILNKPAGDHLIRHGSKSMRVTSGSVSKFRSPAKHQYEANGSTYKALRTDVPVEIKEILRLSEVNLQEQHASYFLIADSPGQVAKTLNKVADLQVIDDSLQAVRQRVREAKTHRKFLSEELDRQKIKVEELDWVKEADRDWQKVEELESSAKDIDVITLATKIDTVEKLQIKFDSVPVVDLDLDRLSKAIKNMDVDMSLADIIKKVEDNQVDIPDPYPDLKLIPPLIEAMNTDVDTVARLIGKVESARAEVSSYPEIIDDIGPVISELAEMQEGTDSLGEIIIEVFVAEDCLEEAAGALAQKKAEYEEWLKEVGMCPLCGGGL